MTSMTRWGLQLLTVLLAAGVPGCGGGGSDEASPASGVRLESAATVTQTVGPAGATLTTTGSDGTAYTLAIPAGALPRAADITLAPIASIAGLPERTSLVAGAQLSPEGQTFDVPVRLSIVPASAPTATLLPFAYGGDLEQRHLYPGRAVGGAVEFEVVHFSGYAALAAQLGDALSDAYFPEPTAAGDQALQALVAAATGMPAGPARNEAMRVALQAWLDGTIKPAAAAAQGLAPYDPQIFARGSVWLLRREMAVFEIALRYAALELAGEAITQVSNEFQVAVRDTARHVVDVSNAGCTAENAFALVVPEILAWQSLAQRSGASALDATLERPAVLEALCVQVAYDPDGGLDFPSGIQPGQTGTLGVRAGYRIRGGPVQFDRPMRLDTNGTHATTAFGAGFAVPVAAGATYAQQFLWEPGTTEMRIDVNACLLDESLREICQPGFVVRGAPTDTCPFFRMTLPGNSATSRQFSGVSLGYDLGGGAIGGFNVLSLTAFAGTVTAESTLYFQVETNPPSAGAVDTVLTWSGDATVEAGSTSVAMQVNGVGATATASATGPLLMQVPIRVRHGDLIRVTFTGTATSPAMDKNVNPRGSIITNILPVDLVPVTCD
jgi:hypothetical protein